MNFWDKLMGSDEGASTYMATYGEGPGFDTRKFIGSLLNNGESVLDVGCGPGWNFDHLLEYGPSVKYRGLDYSPRFIRVASQRVAPMKIFEVGDARKLKEPDGSFDVVLLQDILEHTNGYEKPVEEALRVAKRLVIVSFWHLDGNEGTEHINDDGDDGWGAWYDKSKWERYLNTINLPWEYKELRVEGKTHKWDFYMIYKDKK